MLANDRSFYFDYTILNQYLESQCPSFLNVLILIYYAKQQTLYRGVNTQLTKIIY